MSSPPPQPGRFVRLAETGRAAINLSIDGLPVAALAGDTVLVAMLCSGTRVRDADFGGKARAGFCLMGACQDCWVRETSGRRLRACTTMAVDGMAIVTRAPGADWPRQP